MYGSILFIPIRYDIQVALIRSFFPLNFSIARLDFLDDADDVHVNYHSGTTATRGQSKDLTTTRQSTVNGLFFITSPVSEK